ncbi:polysaccharide lyase family 14 protein [Mixia osmundae IAM 14324]|uniref:polysaccharide lyase family 14 protein n=1 Tax=Mixia osmundae (strain CBS 9802 / IAM 14324 / JCM 22182 / KY 12970) TaxID=764103 RepID=UPI0004A555AA|nr:polysaccharide lyase family 14 protein [Mixia osmundae IAM 14324]KEI41007.1 polysaccharide lyase family 14 protein [Mixia osmundae IAM 14324]
MSPSQHNTKTRRAATWLALSAVAASMMSVSAAHLDKKAQHAFHRPSEHAGHGAAEWVSLGSGFTDIPAKPTAFGGVGKIAVSAHSFVNDTPTGTYTLNLRTVGKIVNNGDGSDTSSGTSSDQTNSTLSSTTSVGAPTTTFALAPEATELVNTKNPKAALEASEEATATTSSRSASASASATTVPAGEPTAAPAPSSLGVKLVTSSEANLPTPLKAWHGPGSMTAISEWTTAFKFNHWAWGSDNVKIQKGNPPASQWSSAGKASDDYVNKNNSLKALYPKGTWSPGNKPVGGFGFNAIPMPISGSNNVSLAYSVFFPKDFDFVLGGKLPGLYGGHTACSGGVAAEDCFSTRLMFRKNGMGELYLYAARDKQVEALCTLPPLSWCDAVYGMSIGRGSWTFKTGEWTNIRQDIWLNTPGKANGGFNIWVNDELKLHSDTVFYRGARGASSGTVKVGGYVLLFDSKVNPGFSTFPAPAGAPQVAPTCAPTAVTIPGETGELIGSVSGVATATATSSLSVGPIKAGVRTKTLTKTLTRHVTITDYKTKTAETKLVTEHSTTTKEVRRYKTVTVTPTAQAKIIANPSAFRFISATSAKFSTTEMPSSAPTAAPTLVLQQRAFKVTTKTVHKTVFRTKYHTTTKTRTIHPTKTIEAVRTKTTTEHRTKTTTVGVAASTSTAIAKGTGSGSKAVAKAWNASNSKTDTQVLGIMADTFFGGSTKQYSSPRDQNSWFRDFSIYVWS